MNQSFFKTAGAVETNARIRFIPDETGVYQPYELLCFSRPVFVPDGWETAGYRVGKKSAVDDLIDAAGTITKRLSASSAFGSTTESVGTI